MFGYGGISRTVSDWAIHSLNPSALATPNEIPTMYINGPTKHDRILFTSAFESCRQKNLYRSRLLVVPKADGSNSDLMISADVRKSARGLYIASFIIMQTLSALQGCD